MTALARVVVTHRWAVVALWLFAIVGAQTAAAVVESDYRNDLSLGGSDSQAAIDLLDERFPAAAGDADTIAWQVERGSALEGETAQEVQALLAEVSEVGSVTAIRGPLAPQAEGMPSGADATSLQVSEDGSIAYASIQYDRIAPELPREDLEVIADLVAEADEAGGQELTVAVTGQGMATLSAPEVGVVEIIGLAFAAVVLLLAFGSLVAMSLPIVSAVAALGVALGTLGVLSQVVTISDVAPVLGVLLGLGVGIDYALFIVNRFRGQLAAGQPVDDAVVAATTTSGRAVVLAGITVIIALAGIFVPGISLLNGLAIGAGIAVLSTMLAAVTLLPALLSLLGHRVLSTKARKALAEGHLVEEHASRAFAGWARLVRTRPVALGLVGLLALGAIAIPTLDLRLGTADQGNDPSETTTRVAYDLLGEGFGPGFNGPLVVVADLSDTPLEVPSGDAAPPSGAEPGAAAPVAPQLEGLVKDLSSDPGVNSVLGPQPNEDGTAAVLQVIPHTSPQDEATGELLDRIRGEYAVAAAEQDVTVHVGGAVATFDDFAVEIADVLPAFFALVIGLSFLLLVIAFRSLLVPLVGALMNLVSAAAAFGVIVAVFQWGWAADLVGVGDGGPIEPFIPIVLFALLFGLSMDYQVFLVSRIAEEWHHRGDNHEAVRVGHAEVGKVIVAAASIMVLVFGGFIFGDARTVKLIGLGLAAAVLLDALVIRMLVVPAIMHLLGPANWWLPGWLDRWLPAVSIEGQAPGRQDIGNSNSTRGRHAAGSTTYPAPAVLSTPDPPAEVDGGEVEGGWAAGFEAGQRAGRRARYDQGFRAGFEDAAQMDPEQRFESGYDAGFQEIIELDHVSESQP